jgi:nucleoside-diphosphate-sugar epimerase
MYFNSLENKKIIAVNPNLRKSILFIDDLCRALIKIIKTKQKKYGVYNLSSFNIKIFQIAKNISKISKSKIILKKGLTQYSFCTCNKKFSKNFNFKFINDINPIIESFY